MDNLIIYANTYQDLYKQSVHSVFHHACSCVVSQQVSFQIGREIRKQLYDLCGFPLTRNMVKATNLPNINNFKPSRISLIIAMTAIDDNRDPEIVLNDYMKLYGFGKWTFDAVSLIMNINNPINLSTDAYIRKNICLYCDKAMTQKECHNFILSAGADQSIVCYFLWRVKKSSIEKVKNKEQLALDDFI
jgi:hypothetical protein